MDIEGYYKMSVIPDPEEYVTYLETVLGTCENEVTSTISKIISKHSPEHEKMTGQSND